MLSRIKKLSLPQQLGLGSFIFVVAIFVVLVIVIGSLFNNKITQLMTTNQQKEAGIIVQQLAEKYTVMETNFQRHSKMLDNQLGKVLINVNYPVETDGVKLPRLNLNYQPINGNSNFIKSFASTIEMRTSILYKLDNKIYRLASSDEELPFEINAANPGVENLLQDQNYVGKASVNGVNYFASYSKVESKEGLYSELLIPYPEILDPLRAKIGAMTFGKDGYIYVTDTGVNKGEYIIHPTSAGKNIFDAVPDLKDTFEKMYSNDKGVIFYTMQVEGIDKKPREAEAVYEKVPGWNWVLTLKSYTDEYKSDVNSVLIIIVIIAAIASILLTLILWYFIRRALAPLREISKGLSELGAGNLTFKFSTKKDSNSHNEIDLLQTDAIRMQDNLVTLINKVLTSSQKLLTSTQSISQANADLRSSATNSQDSSVQVSSAITQISSSIEEMASSANEVSEESISVRQSTEEGHKAVRLVEETVSKLSSAFAQASDTIENVENSSKSIGAVVNVINEIAEQTNLLALNAAIEAARAGEQGRGFAVVADEVRVLAQRTQQSTEEIQKVVLDLQSNSQSAVKEMQAGRSQVDSSVEQTVTAGALLDKIYQSIKTVEMGINNVAAMTQEQSVASSQIRENAESLKDASMETLQQADISQQHSDDIRVLADSLQADLSAFKIK